MLLGINVSVCWRERADFVFFPPEKKKLNKSHGIPEPRKKAPELYKFIAFVSFNQRCSRPLKPSLFNVSVGEVDICSAALRILTVIFFLC